MASEKTRTSAELGWNTVDAGFPYTDVTLIVEDCKIHVNREVLSKHSPVFDAMFNGHFKESTENEIVLNDKKAKDFVEFLRSFYPNMTHSITEKNVLQVLPLAHEYQSSLVNDCEDFMVKMCQAGTGLTVSTLLDYILAAEKFDLTRLLETAFNFCAKLDFELLRGNRSTPGPPEFFGTFSNTKDECKKPVDETISLKFSNMKIETRYSIAEKRLQQLEGHFSRAYDYRIPLQ